MNAPTYVLRTAGQLVTLDSAVRARAARLVAATGHIGRVDAHAGRPDLHVRIESCRSPFPHAGMTPVTRGAWTDGSGHVLFDSVGGSGHSQWWSIDQVHTTVETRNRWRPSAAQLGAATLLVSRQRALEAEVLVHYPAMWLASQQGLAPLHVSVLRVGGAVVALAGPGGLGKSTLVAAELDQSAVALCDNVAVSDGVAMHGLAEPLRLDPKTHFHSPGQAGHTTHHRREYRWGARPVRMVPDLLVVVRRGGARSYHVRETTSEAAARAMVAGTFAAGELGRFWALSATLALATGQATVLPAVCEVAGRLAARVPCVELELGAPGIPLREMLGGAIADLQRTRVQS